MGGRGSGSGSGGGGSLTRSGDRFTKDKYGTFSVNPKHLKAGDQMTFKGMVESTITSVENTGVSNNPWRVRSVYEVGSQKGRSTFDDYPRDKLVTIRPRRR